MKKKYLYCAVTMVAINILLVLIADYFNLGWQLKPSFWALVIFPLIYLMIGYLLKIVFSLNNIWLIYPLLWLFITIIIVCFNPLDGMDFVSYINGLICYTTSLFEFVINQKLKLTSWPPEILNQFLFFFVYHAILFRIFKI